ncbi:helix-turn-helix transcriptional regulator [Streptomyces turgidiscabies]|nr:helix-turn-helix transcriptional regulator [Streptomyces turgidiscabies]MDX3492155.1 helix-turn-helix transcriptional regulator [Streptomyces turgidiscabies]
MADPLNVTSHQHHPGDHAAEDPAPRGEDLAALLQRLLDQVPDKNQKDLADAAGIRYPTLNAWVNRTRGTSRIDPDSLRSLRDVFRSWGVETTVGEFFAAAGRPVPGPSSDEREARLLKLYQQLPEDKQRALVKDAEAMLAVSRAS